jgi:D-alanine-D-alanine ligase
VRKLRVGVLFGGQSGEHEVSLASASSILGALDPEKYEAVPIGITRRGEWRADVTPLTLAASNGTRALAAGQAPNIESEVAPMVAQNGGIALRDSSVDVVFPVLHGPNGEDGSIQGLLRTAGVPFVGSDVLGSALGMDKWRMKAVFAQWGLPNVPHHGFRAHDWTRRPEVLLRELECKLAYPMFVKPSNMGSSVGISKARDRDELCQAVATACRFDSTVIVEEAIEGREIECGVLGNDDPLVSVPGEIRPHHEFYDYEAKYNEGLADLIIPAHVTDEQSRLLEDYARRAFLAVGAAGLARVDFFIRRSDGTVLVNEINTMPGFTTRSMFPKLWEATGVPYAELIDRLIRLALERFDDNRRREG